MQLTHLLPLPTPVFHILIALADGDRHGYGIMQDVADRTGERLRMSPGTLYGSIKRMLEQGLIQEREERPSLGDDERRRYYRITDLGRQAAQAEMARMEEALSHARQNGLVAQSS